MRVIVYVVCPDAASLAFARERFATYDWARPVEGVFPGAVRERRDDWKDAHFVGAVSFDAHMHVALHALAGVLADVAAADVVALLPSTVGAVQDGCEQHPDFLDAWTRALGACDLDDVEHPDIPCFLLNYWLASPACMDMYLEHHERVAAALRATPSAAAGLVIERLAGYVFWRAMAAVVLVPMGLSGFWQRRERH